VLRIGLRLRCQSVSKFLNDNDQFTELSLSPSLNRCSGLDCNFINTTENAGERHFGLEFYDSIFCRFITDDSRLNK